MKVGIVVRKINGKWWTDGVAFDKKNDCVNFAIARMKYKKYAMVKVLDSNGKTDYNIYPFTEGI